MTDDHLQLRVLEALESARNYNRWLADLTRPFLGDDPIEIGSGLGGNARLWLDAGVPRVTVSELDEETLGRLRARFAGDDRVTVDRLDLAEAPDRDHSAVVALNVLEHIEDDVAALKGARSLVRPGGSVVMFVPAFPFAAGKFDRAIGHFRRYTRASLARAYEAAGLDPVVVRYVNAPGLLAWFVSVRMLGQAPRDTALLRAWDAAVIPVVRHVERAVRVPFGQSVLAVGTAR